MPFLKGDKVSLKPEHTGSNNLDWTIGTIVGYHGGGQYLMKEVQIEVAPGVVIVEYEEFLHLKERWCEDPM